MSSICAGYLSGCAPKNPTGYSQKDGYIGNISMSGAFALYPLAIKWGEDFKQENPNVRFNISAGGAGKGIADVLTNMVDIGLVSRDLYPQEKAQKAYSITVAKDAVICTINSLNPNYEALKRRGLSAKEIKGIFVEKRYKQWHDIDASFTTDPIVVYTRSDASGAAETWAKFLKSKQEDLQGIGIFGDPGLAQAIKDDKNAIGFNNINYVYDLKTNKHFPKIDVLPIDINNNGQMDANESFYGTLSELTKAVGTGVYPSPPARTLSFVTKGKTNSLLVKRFIQFVLEPKSQEFLLSNGYVPLDSTTITEELKKL